LQENDSPCKIGSKFFNNLAFTNETFLIYYELNTIFCQCMACDCWDLRMHLFGCRYNPLVLADCSGD